MKQTYIYDLSKHMTSTYRWLTITAFISISMIIMLMPQAVAQSLVLPKTTETYIGVNFMRDIANNIESSNGTGAFPTRSTDLATSYMVRWGYREERTYAIELGYMIMPAWDGTSNTGSLYTYNGRGFFGDLFFFFALTRDVSAYVKFGAARLQGTSSLTVGNVRTTKEVSGWGSSSGIGIEYQTSPSFAIRGGWEYLKIKGVNGQVAKHGAINIGGLLFYE